MRNILFLFICILLISCSYERRLDGKVVKDRDGNKYLLKWNIGDCYFIYAVKE